MPAQIKAIGERQTPFVEFPLRSEVQSMNGASWIELRWLLVEMPLFCAAAAGSKNSFKLFSINRIHTIIVHDHQFR